MFRHTLSVVSFSTSIPFNTNSVLADITSFLYSITRTVLSITMKGPLNIVLEDYDISPINGFIPHELPLQQLDPYYETWEEAVQLLPANFSRKTYRSKVDKLVVLSTSRLHTKAEWQRAYVLLTFMTHGYIWGGEVPAEVSSFFSVYLVVLTKSRYYHHVYRYPF